MPSPCRAQHYDAPCVILVRAMNFADVRCFPLTPQAVCAIAKTFSELEMSFCPGAPAKYARRLACKGDV